MRNRTILSLVAVCLCWAPDLNAAPAVPPAQLSYQGVLLDDQGQAQTGPVDLTVRIYDALMGGTLLYKQSFLSTPLSAGTFTVVLGPAGAASDTPDDPLTTSLADVFSGDLVAGPGRYLELTVGGDPALARIQVLSAPLALRAESAASADVADSATSAQTVVSVGGFDPAFYTEILEHFDFDGTAPVASDPREGVADTDGDGLANFLDPDNDGDGLDDDADLAAGGDMNLVTPTLTGVAPSSANFLQDLTVTLSGTNFEPGMSVDFGTQSPVPSNVTPTSMDVHVGPHPQGTGFVDVTVTRLNGESATATGAFEWTPLTGKNHNVSMVRASTFAIRNDDDPILGRNDDDYQVDTNGNGLPNLVFTANGSGFADYTFNPSGAVRGVICQPSGTNCVVRTQYDRTGNSLPDTQLTIETLVATGSAELRSAAVAATDTREVLSYVRGISSPSLVADVVVAVDYTADDDWADANEIVVLEAGLADATVAAAVKSDGTPVVMWDRDAAGSGDLRLAVDLSGDGDFDDTVGGVPEVQAIGAPGTGCYDVAVDASDRVALVYQPDGAPGVTVLHDLNGDGDFADAGESQSFSDAPAFQCRIATIGNALSVATSTGPTIIVRVDRDGNGDFAGMLETLDLGAPAGSQLGLASSAAGDLFVVTLNLIFGPI